MAGMTSRRPVRSSTSNRPGDKASRIAGTSLRNQIMIRTSVKTPIRDRIGSLPRLQYTAIFALLYVLCPGGGLVLMAEPLRREDARVEFRQAYWIFRVAPQSQ